MSELVAQLEEFDTATLYESLGAGALSGLRPLTSDRRVAGVARTVACPPGDNLAIHEAVAVASDGEVLVVQTHDRGFGVWGEVLTVAAQARGIRALVIDGSVRDIDSIRRLEFPIFASGTCLVGAKKERRGTVQEPVSCAGQLVRPGDLVVGDVSGVIVIPARQAEAVLGRARARRDKETAIMASLREGRTTIELLGLADAVGRAHGEE